MGELLEFGRGPLHEVDLTNPVVHAERDLRAVWRLLRERSPVARHPVPGGPGFWVVASYDLAIEVFTGLDRFTSARGNNIATLLRGGDPAGGRMLAVSDGPRHKRIRRELGRAFTPQALAPYEERIAAGIGELVRGAVSRGDSDFAQEVARPIPMAVVCDLLRVPETDRPALYTDASAALTSEAPVTADLDTRLARNQILLYFAKLVRSYRGEPGDDLLGLLVRLTDSAVELTEDELLYNCYSLLLGGEETTRYTMSGAVQALAECPGEWQRLVAGEVSIESAVEELLRWTTASMHSGRTALCDSELAGAQVSAGDVVTVWNAAANFDEAQFPDPDRLDLGRTPNRHLAFLHGPHICPGARLARLELTALIKALLTYADSWEVTGEPTPVYSTFMKGLCGLPVRFTPRRGARLDASTPARTGRTGDSGSDH
ncbi:cytochrome P450 [Streptomyces sp. NPDC004232]|uniref:cytochrome P450 n=1 Tax=Streptomyces sp. NPDC004232 TaxID=3154454 RepID=UPI001DC1D02A|nr:cytochrome P450 [Streptomyces sp. tea 10]